MLNALSVDPQTTWKGPWRWYEETMLNCCLDLEQVKETGITLRDFQCLAHCQGLSIDVQYCDDQATLEDFRRAVQKACVDESHIMETRIKEDETMEIETGSSAAAIANADANIKQDDEDPLDILVVSYSRKVLQQTGSGHFSPLAAYDATSDSVLILDTA